MTLDREFREAVAGRGAEFVNVYDLEGLPWELRRGHPRAVLVGIPLSDGLIEALLGGGEDVAWEFGRKENRCDAIADWAAGWLCARGYAALSQSGSSNEQYGAYTYESRTSALPHKTIARHGGLGWVGNSNLLVTQEFGSALSMCTLLTDAPLDTENAPQKENLCGDCSVCSDVCPTGALSGAAWAVGVARDDILTPSKCTCCLQCAARCPHTAAAYGRAT